MNFRRERPEDTDAVWQVQAAVFPTVAEADLVKTLRDRAASFHSFVAEEERANQLDEHYGSLRAVQPQERGENSRRSADVPAEETDKADDL